MKSNKNSSEGLVKDLHPIPSGYPRGRGTSWTSSEK